ncbi:hypothetical protein [Hoeflea sp.]|uniref:hypothetical protein n=1 Tax=Hoeflea sp. TaxID=1940281 RepID=UPI002AFF11C3|nr:hypothetical protein [Hoeflea sp.]
MSAPVVHDFAAMKFDRSVFDTADGRIPGNWGMAFRWHRTPQGAAFWVAQNWRLDDAGRAAIDAMIAAYDAEFEAQS